jgi:creatinine amidohydrolase/Fe(II)-dependent formamide hydrolase-like protein
VGAINHWQLIGDVFAEVLEGGPYAADHACEWETSEYLYLAPERVYRDRIVDEIPAHRGGPRWLYPDLSSQRYVHFMNWWSRMNSSGVAGTPSLATAEKGRRMIETTIERLLTICQEFRAMPDVSRVDHRVSPPRG